MSVSSWHPASRYSTASATRYQSRAASVPPLASARTSYSLSSSLPAATRYATSSRRRSTVIDTDDLDIDADDDEFVSSTISRRSFLPSHSSRSSYPSSHAGRRAASRFKTYSYLDDIHEDEGSTVSLADLRMRTSQAREAMDRHKRLIDRYRLLPAQLNGPGVTVGIAQQPESVLSSTRYENPAVNRRMSTGQLSQSSAKPAVSSARRKVRDVLTRSRGSPRMYD